MDVSLGGGGECWLRGDQAGSGREKHASEPSGEPRVEWEEEVEAAGPRGTRVGLVEWRRLATRGEG